MKRILMAIAALAFIATTSMPASALNPQPLPPKVFKVSDLYKKHVVKHVIKKHYAH